MVKRSEFFLKVEQAIESTFARAHNGAVSESVAIENAKVLQIFLPDSSGGDDSENPVIRAIMVMAQDRSRKWRSVARDVATLEWAWEHYEEKSKETLATHEV